MALHPHTRVAFTLELVIGVDPLEGRLLADGAERDFARWLGLALALEQAIAEHQTRDGEPPVDGNEIQTG